MRNDDAMETLFNTIEGISKNNNSPVIGIGKVISTNPLKIKYNGIILEKEEIWINDYLWTNHSRTAKGHIVSATQYRAGGAGDPAFASHNHDIDNDYTDSIITTDTDLKVGYYVAIMPMQDSADDTKQQYIVLCHIMRLDGKYK